MATFTGYLGDQPEPEDYADSSTLESAEPTVGQSVDYNSGFLVGSITARPGATTHTEAQSGHLATSYHDDFFGRIHVIPGEHNLGLVPQTLKKQFEVYNAYLDTSWTVDDFIQDNTDGINLTQPDSPIGDSYPPDSSRTFKYDVSLEGPVQIDAEYEIVFPNEDPSHFITGQRSIVWPFFPLRGMTEILEWNTDIMRTRDGGENRKALRMNPRRSFRIEYRAAAENRTFMENVIQQAQARDVLIPVWTDWRQSKTTTQSGDLTIDVETAETELRSGGFCMIMTDPFSYEIREIDTVSSDSVTLTTALDNTWPQGAFVIPSVVGMIEEEPEFERINDDTIFVEMEFEVNTPYSYFNEGTAAETYLNREVLTDHNYNQEVSDTYRRERNVVDTETGTFKQFDKSGYSNRETTFNAQVNSRTEMLEYKRFLFRRMGQQKSFWHPSWIPDFEPLDPIQSSQTQIDINYVGYSVFVEQLPVRSHIRFLLEDGTTFHREIVGATNNNDGTETIEIGSALNQQVDPSEINRADALERMRLNADRIEVEWQSRKHGELSLPVRTVKQ